MPQTFHGRPGHDLPDAFYQKAVQAFAEFTKVASEYAGVLEAQFSMASIEGGDAADALFARGTQLAQEAEACGRRIHPVREALGQGYAGPRAAHVRHELSEVESEAQRLSDVAGRLAVVCAAQRGMIAAELEAVSSQLVVKLSNASRADAYQALDRRHATLNVAG